PRPENDPAEGGQRIGLGHPGGDTPGRRGLDEERRRSGDQRAEQYQREPVGVPRRPRLPPQPAEIGQDLLGLARRLSARPGGGFFVVRHGVLLASKLLANAKLLAEERLVKTGKRAGTELRLGATGSTAWPPSTSTPMRA